MNSQDHISISAESRNRVLHGEPIFDEVQELVIISKQKYLALEKAKRNAEYLQKLDKSYSEIKDGKSITFSIDELEAMESENWSPTQKISRFRERMDHE